MDAAKEKRLIEMFTLDDEFHQYIVRNSPNPYMWMSMELIYNQNTRLRVLRKFLPESIDAVKTGTCGDY